MNDKKNWMLSILDNVVAYLKKNFSDFNLREHLGKCVGDGNSGRNIRKGVLKLIFFFSEISQGEKSLQIMINLPVISMELMNGNFLGLGKGIGNLIKLAANSPINDVDENKFDDANIFSCAKNFAYNMFTFRQNSNSDQKDTQNLGYLAKYNKVIELTRNDCILLLEESEGQM